MILEGSSRVRALICVKPLSLSSHICVTKHTTNAPSYRTRRLGRSREHGVDEVGNDRASLSPVAVQPFKPPGALPGRRAPLRGPSRPLAPPSGTRAPCVFVSQSVKKASQHRDTDAHFVPGSLASSTPHDLDTMVARWSAPIPLCMFVSSEQRTRVLSLFFRCLIMLVDFMPAVHLDTCPLACIAMAAQLSR